MKKILLGTGLALAVAVPAITQDKSVLSSPIVLFTPVIMKNADALELPEAQRGDLKEWRATMPAAREAVEAEAVAVRAARGDHCEREKLTAEPFAKLVDMAAAT